MALSIIASLLHCVGFWALWHVKQSNPYLSTQRLYLLNLSMAENFHSFFLGLYYLFAKLKMPNWANYFFICAGGGAFIWYLSIMIMLTADRFLTVYLNVRYLVIWNVRKTQKVLIACFAVGFIANIVFLITIPTFDESLEIFSVYLWFPVDNGFILVACFSYAYIFRRVYNHQDNAKANKVKPRARTIQSQASESGTSNTFGMKVESVGKRSVVTPPKFPLKTFIVPFLLITTFIIFIGFPDNTYFWYFILNKEVPKALDTLFFIFYPTGIMSDAIIYVLCAKDVRTYLFRRLGLLSRKPRSSSTSNISVI